MQKADEATKTRFRGHGSNVTKEEQGDCLKVAALFDYFSMTKIIGGHPGRHDRELLGLPFPVHHRVSFFMLASLFTNNDQVFDDWSPHHLQHVEERWSTAHLCNGWRVRGEERKNFPGIAMIAILFSWKIGSLRKSISRDLTGAAQHWDSFLAFWHW